jgi:hypothetical protein
MIHFTGHPSDIYRQQLKALLKAPEVEVRGRPTRELLHVVTEICPLNVVQIIPGRKLNPWLALSEALALIAGSDLVRHLEPYNKRIKDFSDDGITFYGSYGARIVQQVPALIARLRNESTDRRAVLSIWRDEDLEADTKDPPCNDLIMFKLRDEKLHMTVHNRSNDLHWGLHAVNLPEFSVFQQYLAMLLGVGLGTQIHWSDSLHLYLDGPAATLTENMLAAMDEPIVHLPAPFLFPDNELKTDHVTYAKIIYHILDGTMMEAPPFLKFASDFLQFYRDRTHPYRNLRFNAWSQAGMEFLG